MIWQKYPQFEQFVMVNLTTITKMIDNVLVQWLKWYFCKFIDQMSNEAKFSDNYPLVYSKPRMPKFLGREKVKNSIQT